MPSVLAGLFSRSESKGKSPSPAEARSALYRSLPALSPALQYIRDSGEILPDVVHAELLPQLAVVEACLGRPISESRFDGEIRQPFAYPHEQIALYMALRACEVLNANDPWWMEWSTSGREFITPSEHRIAGRPAVNAEEVVRMAWIKTLFQAALVLPIGYLVSHTSWRTRRDGMAWNPAEEDMAQYRATHEAHPEVFLMRSIIDPRTVSHAAFRRLFPASLIRIPGLSFALADFFSPVPTPSNPFYLAWHNAMHFFFFERAYNRLPFWWVTLINHHFCRSETYRPISCVVLDTAGETDWSPPSRSRETNAPAASVPEPQAPSDPSVSLSPVAASEASVPPALSDSPPPPLPSAPPVVVSPQLQPEVSRSDAPEELSHPPPVGSADSESLLEGIQTVFDEHIDRPRQDPISVHSARPPALSELTLRGVADFSDRAARNLVKINCKGAVLQKYDGTVFLVYPLFFRQLSEFMGAPDATADALQQAFSDDGLLLSEDGQLFEHYFEIRPPGATRRLGKLRALPLSDVGVDLLFPKARSVPDNDSLSPLGVPDTAHA